MEPSEFGRGLIVCLVKFAEHFENKSAKMIGSVIWFYKHLDDKSQFEKYDITTRRQVKLFQDVYLKTTKEMHPAMSEDTQIAYAISRIIEHWANGATDHLYEIEIPENWKGTEIEEKVEKLKDKGLQIGHGFTGKMHRYEDYVELKELTEEIALLIDKQIGIDSPDLGEC